MKISPGNLWRSWQCTDDDVHTRGVARQDIPANRSQSAPDKITRHGVTHRLSDDEAEACGLTKAPGEEVNDSVRRTHAFAPPYSSTEISRTDHPVRPGEHRGMLCGELGATLAAASSQDRATGTGTHTEAEAVHLGAATVVRLESSLAHSGISKAQL
jgi:hypothetical protein